jgi:hypothetical protein
LRRVIDAWNGLSDAAKQNILELVDAGPGNVQDAPGRDQSD